jgi:plastocyanin
MGPLRLGTLAMARAAALAAAAACGGDNSRAPITAVSLAGNVNRLGTKTVRNGDTVDLEADTFYFGPTFSQGPAGAKITVNLGNEGKSTHTFTIDAQNVNQQLGPDAKATVTVTIPSSGSMLYYCNFHHDQGMQGAFVVG